MRYTIAKENEVKQLASEGRTLEYIVSVTGIPPKVVWGWCPELRPHEDVIKQSVKQRFHFIYPDFEAKISSAFSPFVRTDISDDDWDMINKVIYDTLFEESLYVFKNVLNDPPEFTSTGRLSNQLFLDYLKEFWSMNSSYVVEHKCKFTYVKSCRDAVHYWSALRNKKIQDVSKGDVELIHEKLVGKKLSPSRICQILKVGLIPLKVAYKEGMTLLKTYDYQLPKKDVRKDIDKTILTKVLNYNWKSAESYTANLVGCQTKMQLREVRALTLKDIFTDGYIYASHIYENGQYLPNPNARVIKVSSTLIDWILKYTSTTPYI